MVVFFDNFKCVFGSLVVGVVCFFDFVDGWFGFVEGIESVFVVKVLIWIFCWVLLGNECFGFVFIFESVCELYLFVDNDVGGDFVEECVCSVYISEGCKIIMCCLCVYGIDWNDVL